jgi:hypothetical protein
MKLFAFVTAVAAIFASAEASQCQCPSSEDVNVRLHFQLLP